VFRLEQNYRSTQGILDAANGVIAHNRDRQPKRLWSDLGRGEPVRVVECDDESGEARYVAGQVSRLLDEGSSASEVAVFYRTNAQSRAIEDVLRRQDIPYQVVGGLRFYDRAEVKDAMAYLQVVANPADAIALRRVVNAPRRGIGDTTVSRLVQHAEAMGITLREALGEADAVLPGVAARRAVRAFSETLAGLEELALTASVSELLERALDDSGYRDALREERTIEARGRLENLDELVGVAREFDVRDDGPRDLGTFLQELSLVSDADEDEHEDRGVVTLMTLHTAKGLEFPAVFLVGLEDGVFPHQRAIEEANLEEERRLMYVGMTRARTRLVLTYCRSRFLFGARMQNAPSQFLAEIPQDLLEHERVAPVWTPSAARSGTYGRQPSSGPAFQRAIAPPPRTTGVAAVRPKTEAPLLATGDTVRHSKFGEGIVIGRDGPDRVVVRFPESGEKLLDLSYAPLEKVG
jgi:DNA helicase-2/ATP-dependent DNA helicase PcrA